MQRTATPATAPFPNRLRLYWLETRYEFLKLLRLPAYAAPTIAFPLLFYLFFGIAFAGGKSGAGPVSVATYLLATYGAFGVIGASLFGFGVGVAVERGQGWLTLKQASPMPPGAYFAAKVGMSLLFSGVIVLALYGLGAGLGGVRLEASQWVRMGSLHVLGAIPFCAFGLAIGYWAGPNSAPAVVNLIYLPMAFASGLWIPITLLPGFFQRAAPFLPAYHYAQLALGVPEADAGGNPAGHAAYLLVFTAASLLIARWGYRRNADVTYG